MNTSTETKGGDMTNPETQPNPEHFHYKSSRDHVLHDMALTGWANASSGEPASHVGFFARISNSAEELHEVVQAFEANIEAVGLQDVTELIGHYMVAEYETGAVHVLEYPNANALKIDYENLEVAYGHYLKDVANGVYGGGDG